MRPLLTVAVIAKDEEGTLPSLFGSLEGLSGVLGISGGRSGSQIVLVDTGSRDGTRALAATHGAEVHDFEWRDDFSAARNRALELSRGEWILWLDADDELPGKTGAWLAENLDRLDSGSAYAFRVRSPGPDGSDSECVQIRLFPNGKGLNFRNPVHENIGESVIEAGLAVSATGLEILHSGYRDARTVERKRIRNRALLAKAMEAAAPAPSLRLAWGRMGMAEGRYEEAEAAFRGVLEAPARASRDVLLAARVHLGQALCFRNQAPEALKTFREAAAAHPECRDHAPYLLEYGKALWLTGYVAEARAAWTACLNSGAGADTATGSVPADWEGIRAGAGLLLKETHRIPRMTDRIPAPPPHPDPSRGRGGRRLDLSVCSIVRNEAANVEGLLASLPLSRLEWVVMDTGSRDGTVEMLLQAGVKANAFAWCDDFSAARNASLELATRGWILWIDADDRLDESFWEALEPLLDGPRRAYRFLVSSPRENSRGDCFRQVRLFPNRMGIRFEGRIHEQLGTSLQKLGVPVEQANLEILHLGYDTADKRAAKLKRNRALLERERLEHPRDPAVVMEYGNCLYQSAEYAQAREAYLSLMPSADPRACGNPPADEVLRHFPALLAETCLKLNRGNEAGEWFRLAAGWNPGDIRPLYWLGKNALESDNVHGALEYFYAAVDRPLTIGKVAMDNHSVRRNALALVVLCEIRLFGAEKAPRGRECLRELIAGGLKSFPLDPRVPWEFLLEAGSPAEAECYARAYLDEAPGDISMWEDLIEHFFAAGRHREVMEIFGQRPALCLRSGILEAFRAKSGEAAGLSTGEAYAIYRDALRLFPEDPTLLVYFSDFVNHNKLYARCYEDLKSLDRPSETVRDFMRQIEALGYGGG